MKPRTKILAGLSLALTLAVSGCKTTPANPTTGQPAISVLDTNAVVIGINAIVPIGELQPYK